VQSNVDANMNGDSAGDRAFVNPLGQKGIGSASVPICDTALGPCTGTITAAETVGYYAANPNAYYVAAGAGTAPNGKRNDLPLRGIKNIDATAMKRFNLYKQTKLEFSAQIWNVLNKSQYIPGSINGIGSYGYASTTSMGVNAHSGLIPGNSLFNHPELIYANNARNMQLSLKFIF
jgi:hypothetical protein